MEIIVRKNGQITIPICLRKKYNIEEGDRLDVIETKDGILFKRKLSIWDMVGSCSQYATAEEMNRQLDRLRHEDDYANHVP
ncbi:MAG: AbrB/MazE/SpoVT family DNA-binding domain-containing protein [Chloroflexi bacterium]|nr:AbrB/MazE/SpoVT family DNA-binding domain-containing protein [Chloroflexota bacterium]